MRQRTRGIIVFLLGLLSSVSACMNSEDTERLPPDVQDPTVLRNPAGAMELYRGALVWLPRVFDGVLLRSGLLTDELTATSVPSQVFGVFTRLDSRQNLDTVGQGDYNALHRLRAQTREARGFLTFAPDSSPALMGHMYAAEGYADLFLADLFCSGIPLSTVDYDADYTLTAGFTTEEVYRQALTLFDSAFIFLDSALVLNHADSARLRYLAAVGRGRVLLALGRYAEAAAAVAEVPDDYQYQMVLPGVPAQVWLLYFYSNGGFGSSRTQTAGLPTVANQEGGRGLGYRSSADPRTAFTTLGPAQYSNLVGSIVHFPAKYTYATTSPATLADGVEARLIEAEGALAAGDPSWLATLNALRTTGIFTTQPTPDPNDDPAATDTLWQPSVAGQVRSLPGLRPLVDPGAGVSDPAAAATARVDLVFRERAFWLYLTAHRQGDLRRLVRLYQREPDAVYPADVYPGGTNRYGDEIVFPVPALEQERNPNYSGCNHGNA